MRHLFRRVRGLRQQEDRVHRILTESLYAQPLTLAISTISAIAACWVVAWITRSPIFAHTALAITLVASVRQAGQIAIPRLHGKGRTLAADMFMGCSLLFAFLVGNNAALTVRLAAPFDAQLLANGYAIAFSAGIAARNASRPSLAIGQMMLALLPPILALALRPGVTGKLIALNMTMMLPAMTTVTISIYRAFRRSIAAAETSARMADRLRIIARNDAVTGLLNRAGLDHAMPRLIDRAFDCPAIGLLWIDLDRFKEVNDVLGHQTGDRILAEVALRLRRMAPTEAVIARFGGDEFVLGCPVNDAAELRRLATDVLGAIRHPMRIDGQSMEVSASIGVAMVPAGTANYDALMQSADLALYEAKAQGRGRICHFRPEMAERMARRREIEAELRHAVQNDELDVHFQPIVDLGTGRIRSFEALARWSHPTKGELSPEEFIAIAEESGSIITLGNWLTARAARVAASWPREVTLAINLSPLQIRAPGAALAILGAIRRAGLDPHRLEVEITESVLLEPSPATSAFIGDLYAAGVRFALDDFGTGYSSLASLQAHPFSRIKIDRRFVSGLQTDHKSHEIVRAIAAMAGALGMDVVAEGIETEEQASTSRAAGCTLGQGYLYSRALPASQTAEFLAREHQATAQTDRAPPSRMTAR